LRVAVRKAVLILLAGTATACGAEGGASPAFLVRDSGGVQIVESARPLTSGPPFLIDSLPAVDIGGIGDPHHEFPGPVSSAVRLSDGRIVVAAWATTELRVFDSTGQWVRDLGRRGSGPGEFEGLGWVHLGPGDTIVTFEPMNRRVSVFDSEGPFQRLFSLRPPGGRQAPDLRGVLDDGLLVLANEFVPRVERPTLVTRATVAYRYTSVGEVLDLLTPLPLTEVILVPDGGIWTRPYETTATISVLPDRFFVGSTAAFDIRTYRPDGTVERIVRRPETSRPLASGEYDAAVDSLVESWGGTDATLRARVRRIYERIPAPARRPAFSRVLATQEGGLWLQHYGTPTRASDLVSVFNESGRWLGDVDLPDRFWPLQVGAGYVLGTWSDADGVAHVRLHRTRRP
jgi:hypothetical protein